MNYFIVLGFLFTIIMLFFAIKNDLKNNTIKNIIPFLGLIIGVILSIFNNNLFINVIICFLFFFLLFAIPRLIGITEFMGAGDIKLYMAITFLMGYKFSIYSFIYSIFVGLIFLSILNIKRIKEVFFNIGLFFVSDKKEMANIIDNKKANVFSPYILIGTIITFIQIYILKNDWLIGDIENNIKVLISNLNFNNNIIYILIILIIFIILIYNIIKKIKNKKQIIK